MPVQHCSEGAFAALRASIEERRKLRLRLDPSILMLGSVELVGKWTPPVYSVESLFEIRKL